MTRVYPPKWCENDDCKKCDFLTCNDRFLKLLEPYRDINMEYFKRKRVLETTIIALYLSYCQRLAKFFLQFPSTSPIPVVFDNFFTPETDRPSRTNIQRILFDMLNHGDPDAPTDEIHELRLLFASEMFDNKRKLIIRGDKDVEVKKTKKERKKIFKKANEFSEKFFDGKITSYNKTAMLIRCKYCFLKDCEEI